MPRFLRANLRRRKKKMNDPYRVLGVSPSDSDEKIKEAYRELIKKYHPDNYSQSPVSDIANEKMSEINAAFDEIMNMRRGSGYASHQNDNASYDNSGSSDYYEIRRLIQSGDITRAEGCLDAIPNDQRGGEWYFLKGSVCYTRGWLNEAFENFTTASNMEPQNAEYRAALNQMQRNRQGQMNGSPYQQYRTGPNTGGCTGCDLCQGLICADCCCECMGGDLISCC